MQLMSLCTALAWWVGCSAPPPPSVPPLSAKVLPLKAALPANPCVGVVPPEDKWLPLPDVQDADVQDADVQDADVQDADVLEGDADVADLGPGDVDAPDVLAVDVPSPLPPLPPFDVTEVPPDSDADGSDGDVAEDADQAADGGVADGGADVCSAAPATCAGALTPRWEAFDFQPASCGFQATYGLDQFRGRVTVVALLAGW